MVDLGVLDNVIGVIVVVLLLSMMVQSMQTFIKRISKFKSRQIEKSLHDLFEKVAPTAPPAGAATAPAVLDHFRELGRVTSTNKNAIESISKADLSKVVSSIESSSLLPDKAKEAIANFLRKAQEAQQALETLITIELPGDVAAKVAELKLKIAPLIAHAVQLIEQQGSIKGGVVMRDVASLLAFPQNEVEKIIAELEVKIEQARAAAADNALLQRASAAVKDLGKVISEMNLHFGKLTGHLLERIRAIEAWYDPVMQGFEERYARHMQTWAFLLSIAIAVLLDADIARLYKRMATDDVSKQRVLAESTAIQQRYLDKIAKARAEDQDAVVEDLSAKLKDELDEAAASYPALGLELLDIKHWISETTPMEKTKSIAGWLVMAFLLSLGAPFWHDTLQSVFSLKNFIRGKSETRAVEQATGAGATS